MYFKSRINVRNFYSTYLLDHNLLKYFDSCTQNIYIRRGKLLNIYIVDV